MGDLIIRPIRRDELQAFAALHAQTGRALTPALLEWEYFDPDLTREGIIVGAFDQETLIGTQGYIPYRAWWNGRTILTCKSESTLVAPSHRGRQVFDRMYALGFELCRQAGVECIWGFTSAEKPFAKVGFDVSGALFQEFLSWSPVSLYRAIRHQANPKVSPKAWQATALDGLQRPGPGEFGLERDIRYLRHRYLNNPMRDIAFVDHTGGILFSFGGRHPYLLRVSEVVDPAQLTAAVRRCKGRVGRDFLGLERSTNHPGFGWTTLPGSVYYRRRSPMRIVFKWLGALEGQPIPKLDVEEGYAEGVR